MIFAALVIEREPLKWADLPIALVLWLQDAGGFAAAGILVWLLYYWLRRPAVTPVSDRPMLRNFVITAMVASLLAYLAAGAVALLASPPTPQSGGMAGPATATSMQLLSSWCLVIGGACAMFAVGLPFMADFIRLRWRRVWAIAKVSFKEAIRRKILWVFSTLILVFLFASWFIDYKPENQVRNYVQVVYWPMTVLLLITAGLLASFSIPADIRNQTIYTIVTKPVERFEIVLGRFVGYTLLMTLVLIVMTSLSLVYLLRELNEEAVVESKKARVPLFGEVVILPDPQNVGYEWEYRRFLPGGPQSPYRAIWSFNDIPAHLAARTQAVPCEFSFEIFRTTKGVENQGVFCTFTAQTASWDPAQESKYDQERDRARGRPDADPAKVDDELAEQFGFFKLRSKEVVDYHTLSFEIPAGIFRNALKAKASGTAPAGRAPLQIVVKCESPTQYIGVAKRDLYLLDADRSFEWNFYKASVGLWLRLCLVIGVAVACSTYLSGVIAALMTMFLYFTGFIEEFVRNLAYGRSEGGGPVESFVRLVNREGMMTPLDDTPTKRLAEGSDELFRWMFRRLLNIIPDIEMFDFTAYAAEGFDISEINQILLCLVILIGYLLPWGILAYYLMKTREVAA